LVTYSKAIQDDPRQAAKASKLVESLTPTEPGFATLVTVVELFWVLTASYDLSLVQVVTVFDAVIRIKQLLVEQANQVLRALRVYGAGSTVSPWCVIPGS